MLYIFFTILFLVGLFIATHLRPLTEEEIEVLSKKKRLKAIKAYFTFDYGEFVVDKVFKKKMNPNGGFHTLSTSLQSFPSIAAGLLKYKKHEWIIIGFEVNKIMTKCWFNKGLDKSSVGSYLSPTEMSEIAKNNGSSTILIFHNHPNGNPNKYDFSRPSEQDVHSATIFSETLRPNGINLLEFVCERGRHHKYYEDISPVFFPVSIIIEEVKGLNGVTKWGNLQLHMSRFF